MDNLLGVRTAITIIKRPVTTNYTKLKNYATIRDHLDLLIKKSYVIQDRLILKEVFDLANSEVITQDANLQQIAFSVLNLLFMCNFSVNFLNEIPTVYLQLAFDDCSTTNETVKNAAYECLCLCLKVIITNNSCDLQSLFLRLSDKSIHDKVFSVLSKAYADVSSAKGVIFFYERSVCAMFESSNTCVRDSLIKLNNQLLPKFKITLLSNKTFENFKAKVRKSYVPRIVQLRCSRDHNWSYLFKFILKCFGKLLHVQVDVINDLLKAVESAFRSSNLDDRFQAFECWKELIDNYSLDMNRLCGQKQMKLLITPLKTNISTNDHIIYKRFEIWIHLFNILQDKAIGTLEHFLQFCFGNSPNESYNWENYILASENKQLYEGSTQALLEIMGHFEHNDLNPCFQFSQPFLKLYEPLVNFGNFENVVNSIVQAVPKCSSVSLQWMNVKHIPKMIYCLWGSLFVKVKELPEERREQVLHTIVSKLQLLLQNENYQYIIVPILELLMKNNFFEKQFSIKTIFFPLSKYLFANDISIPLNNSVIDEFIQYSKDYDNIEEWLQNSYEIIFGAKSNFQNVLSLWIECTNFVQETNEIDGEHFRDVMVDFMVWPMLHKEVINSKVNQELIKKWKSTFRHVSKLFPKEALTVIEKLETISNRENVFIICSVYRVFCQLLEISIMNNFEIAVFNLTQHLLVSFTLRKSDVILFVPAVTILLNNITSKSDASYVASLCNCVTILLQEHKRYRILDALEENIEKIVAAIPESLYIVLSDIETLTSNDEIILKAKNVLKKINSFNDKNASETIKKSHNVGFEPSSLQLFGQHISSPNHADIRGSRLNDKTIRRTPKEVLKKPHANSSLIVDEDDTANYVVIDTDYTFDPKKLSDHQLEVIKSRKSDIPALYQDLSQSQSNLASSNSDSKLPDTNFREETPNEERVNLCVPNPSQEQIEAMIRKNDINKDEVKKRERVEKELMKLKLDVVGGEFLQNIDLMGKRETRRKSDQNFKQFKFLRVGDSTSYRHSRKSDEPKQETGRGKRKRTFDSPLNSNNLQEKRIRKNVDYAKKMHVTGDEVIKESEDIIESSQKTQNTNGIDDNVVSVLQSDFEEIVSKISETVSCTDPSTTIKEPTVLTEEKQETCNMETETLSLCDEICTPKKEAVTIPTSPVETDTPTRTSDLIKDTVNISPIKLPEDNKKTEELFESDDTPLTNENEVELQIMDNDIQLTFFKRSKKLPPNKFLSPINKRFTKIIKSPVVFSAQTHRIMKMMQKCEKKLEFHEQLKVSIEKVNNKQDDANEEFFKFVRELPGPKASPRCSILKRNTSEFMNDGFSPTRAMKSLQKRVNFPDPPTTSKMVYVPDSNEHSNADPESMELFSNENESCEENVISEENIVFEQSRPDNTETQGSVELVDVQLLNSSDPVFKDLENCVDDVEVVVKFLSDSMFAQSLLDELHDKNIRTVADLAKLTETEVNRLPIKSPKLTNLHDVLNKHYLQKSEQGTFITKTEVEVVQTSPKTDHKQKRRIPLKTITEIDDSKINDFKPLILEPVFTQSKTEEALNKILEDLDNVKLLAKKEGMKLTALCKVLVEIIDPNELLQILRDKGEFSLSSFVNEKDLFIVLKEAINNMGLRKFITLLYSIPDVSSTSTLQMLIDESIRMCKDDNSSELQRTISRLIQNSPPSVVLQHLNIQEIIKEVCQMCNDSKLSKTDFFASAFEVLTPTIEEIIPSFHNIQLIKLQEKSAERSEENLLTFIERVLPIVDNSKVCLMIPKKNMLPLFTREELTERVIECSTSSCDIVDSCEKLIRQLPSAKTDENTYEPLFFSLFDKTPTSDICRYISKYFSKFADNLQNKQQL
ncbi:hypothetical protein FQR65_LT13451 [Abscondita terminalis]|nr:hypothetical protein FQR65_LT13451 [Abscondita terminalis]